MALAKPHKSNFAPAETVRQEMELEVRNVVLHDLDPEESVRAALAASPFGNLGYAPDRWKAYMEFDICHSLPAILGPVAEGFYCAYLPQTLEASHSGLLHQQVNLNHLLKAYSREGDEVAKDRIVGCVVATYFPKAPIQGWQMGSDPEAAPSIRACAAIFKLADGVNRVVGDHQTSRKKQSISIEAITSLDNIGIYFPSRGVEGIIPVVDLEEQAILDILEISPLKIGKLNGEQGVFIYGLQGRAIDLRGVGLTPRPAEAEAKIISFAAAQPREIEGGTLMALAASKVDQEIVGRKVSFNSGCTGRIEKVWSEGRARLPGNNWSMAASAESPVLEIVIPKKGGEVRVLRKLSELEDRIKG